MYKLTITDAAQKWGISRNTIYAKIRNGELSRQDDKLLDFAELLRVFGEPSERSEENTKGHDLTLKIKLLEQQLQFYQERQQQAENTIKKLEQQNAQLLQTITELTQSIKRLEPPKAEKKEKKGLFFGLFGK